MCSNTLAAPSCLDDVRRSCARVVEADGAPSPSPVAVDRAAAAALVASLPEPAALREAAAKVPGCCFPVRRGRMGAPATGVCG
jgi:hypothetical protein